MDIPNYTPDFKRPYTLPDGSVLHAAFYRELPNCIAQGSTPGEALSALREMLPVILDQMRASGVSVPEPLPPPAMRHVKAAPLQTGTTETAGAGSFLVAVRIYTSPAKAFSAGSGKLSGFPKDELTFA